MRCRSCGEMLGSDPEFDLPHVCGPTALDQRTAFRCPTCQSVVLRVEAVKSASLREFEWSVVCGNGHRIEPVGGRRFTMLSLQR